MTGRSWTVDTNGLNLPAAVEGALDVFFGEERIWSFSCAGEGRVEHGHRVHVSWPARLVPLLDGYTEVRVAGHNDKVEHFRDEVQFGSATTALRLRDDAGNPISIDKTGRLQRSFTHMADGPRAELIDAGRVLTDTLVALGVDTYLAYGCLLGAAREGRMIGHDSDIDLAFLSKHDHPFDVIRESRWIEREARKLGWGVARLSAANFKVWVPLSNGKRAGVDVFGSFYVGDQFHLTGNLRGHLPREALMPLASIELEGVQFPAPADLDAFLSFTYGPQWRVPDPAFHFNHPEATKDRMNAWLRTTRTGTRRWDAHFTTGAGSRPRTAPSGFAEWVAGSVEPQTFLLELGSGSGRDAAWLKSQGFEVLASDYSSAARKLAAATADAEGHGLAVRQLNLNSTMAILVRGGRLAQRPGIKHVLAHDVIDYLLPSVRPYVWRLCSMVGRTGGRTFFDFSERTDADQIAAEITKAGGYVAQQVDASDRTDRAGMTRVEAGWKR